MLWFKPPLVSGILHCHLWLPEASADLLYRFQWPFNDDDDDDDDDADADADADAHADEPVESGLLWYIYIYIFKQAQLIKKRGLSRFRMSKVSCCKENEEGKCPLRKTGNLNPIEVLCWMGCPWDQVIPVDHVPCRYSAIKGAMSLPIVKNLKFSAKTIENIHEHLTCEYLRSKLQCPIAGWYASFSC